MRWTKEEDEIARQLLASNAPDSAFRSTIGRTRESAKSRMERERFKAFMKDRPKLASVPSKVIPDEVWLDLERRMKAPRSLTAILMGDPEPGRRRL